MPISKKNSLASYKKLCLLLILLFSFYVVFSFLNVGPPLIKKVQSKMGLDYGLITYSFDSDCNGRPNCFINNIPKPQNSNYSRIGDVFFGMESKNTHINYSDVVTRILADKKHKDTFLVQYLNHMQWIEYLGDKQTLKHQPVYTHDYKLAKDILLNMKSKYLSPSDDELVIYIRASDKLDPINAKTCRDDNCQSIIQSYPDYLYAKALEAISKSPEIKHITIVTANYNMKKRYIQQQKLLFNQLLAKFSTLRTSIRLHSSNDLDEDIFYMGTSKHLITSNNIGNLSLLVSKINAS